MNTGTQAETLVGKLRRQLAEAEAELRNSKLFTVTRQQLQARAVRLRREIDDLTHATAFVESAGAFPAAKEHHYGE